MEEEEEEGAVKERKGTKHGERERAKERTRARAASSMSEKRKRQKEKRIHFPFRKFAPSSPSPQTHTITSTLLNPPNETLGKALSTLLTASLYLFGDLPQEHHPEMRQH